MAWLNEHKRIPKGEKKPKSYWAIAWRTPEGKTRTRGIGFCTKAEAKRVLKIWEGKQAAGEAVEQIASDEPSSAETPDATASPTWTLANYYTGVFLPVVRRDKAPKTFETAQTAGNALLPQIGHLALDQVSFAAADAYISVRRELGRRSRTLILEMRWLKACLAHAHDCGVLVAVPKLPRIQDRDRRPHRYLTSEETVAVLDALRPLAPEAREGIRDGRTVARDPLAYLAILTAVNTGCRRGEILSRMWQDVRWNQGTHGVLVICARPEIGFRVKKDRERAIPLPPELALELKRAHVEAGSPSHGWIFPSPNDATRPRKEFIHALKAACERAGIPPIHPHGLRHTWASRLAVSGVDRRTLMELGGWKEGRMLDEVYAHSHDDHKVDVMSRMGIGASGLQTPKKTEGPKMLDRNARQQPVPGGEEVGASPNGEP